MNKLMDHLPFFYEEIREFRELTDTGSIQLEQLSKAINQFLDNQYVLSSSESAIARREKVFRIVPDTKKESLDFRKKRVLSRMQNKPPYVLEYLRDLLDSLLGNNKHSIDLDIDNFELEVLVDVESAAFYKEVKRILDRIVPLNMEVSTAVLIVRECLVMKAQAYSFPINYRICNMFRTDEIPGGLAKVPIDLREKAYSLDVLYPICNTFTTSEISVENEQINVSLTEEYQNNDVLFKRVGTVKVGEGEI